MGSFSLKGSGRRVENNTFYLTLRENYTLRGNAAFSLCKRVQQKVIDTMTMLHSTLTCGTTAGLPDSRTQSPSQALLGSSTLGMGAFSTLVLWPDVSCCLAGKEGKGVDYTTFPLVGPLTQWLRWRRGTSLEVEREKWDRMCPKIEQTDTMICSIFFLFLYSTLEC